MNLTQLKIRQTEAEVMRLTHLSQDQITVLRIDLAFAYLESIGWTDRMQTQLASTPEFWSQFWLPEWHRSDMLFLQHVQRYDIQSHLTEWYHSFHSHSYMNKSVVTRASLHTVVRHFKIKQSA